MSTQPWDLDREELTEALAREVVAEQFPQFASAAVRYLARGYDNDCFVFDEAWILRFPRRAEVAPWVRKEVSLLSVVEPALTVRVPKMELLGEPSARFPYPFVGYRMLPGVTGDRMDNFDESALAATLGVELGKLHGIPLSAFGKVELASPSWMLEDDLRDIARLAPAIEDVLPGDLRPHWAPILDGLYVHPSPPHRPLVLVHNDLSHEHLLFDLGSGDVTGIIDWADAEFGYPTQDMAFFDYIHGPDFTAQLLAHYPHPISESELGYMRATNHLRCLRWIVDAANSGEPSDLAKHLEWIRAHAARLSEPAIPGHPAWPQFSSP